MVCLRRIFRLHTDYRLGDKSSRADICDFMNSGRAARAALFVFFAGLIALVGFVATVDFAGLRAAALASPTKRETIKIVTASGPQRFQVEIADTPEMNAKGLMFRRSLRPRHGMLFLYEFPQEITMWMRNTYISLDMLFIKENGRIHRISSQTEPFSEALIPSGGKVTAVLEIGGGEAARLGVRKGDLVVHSHFSNK